MPPHRFAAPAQLAHHRMCTHQLLLLQACLRAHTHTHCVHIQVEALSQEKGISVPKDMLEIAAKFGLRLSALNAYFNLQVRVRARACVCRWGLLCWRGGGGGAEQPTS